ncbi:MAG: MoaD/ThiS family protein [Anaerolineaceae bacterium]|nr:MoaD/ThiS family protein [Anaerolineaceae bacterium]
MANRPSPPITSSTWQKENPIVPNIKIPTPLRPYTDNQSQVSVTGETVGEVLNALVNQYPDLRTHLFNGDELRNFVNIFLGDEDTRFMDGLNTDVEPDDQLRIVPTIAGG